MYLRRNSYIKQASLLLVCLSLGIKALIPVSYMPAAVGDGWPVKACHNGLPHDRFEAHGEYHKAIGEDHKALWEHCYFGVLSADFNVEDEYQFEVGDFEKSLLPAIDASRMPAARPIVFRSRAPPLSKH